jgi:predicted transcriptional regulator
MVVKVVKYIGSAIAKRVLKNRPDLHKKFDDIMKNDVDPSISQQSQISQALNILRSQKVDKKSTGGMVFKGSDYYKDLL